MTDRFVVVPYRPHARAATLWLIIDTESSEPGQLAACVGEKDAKALTEVLNADPDRLDTALGNLWRKEPF